jgi:hypothetical protein
MVLLAASWAREGFVCVREWRAVVTRWVGSLMKWRAGRRVSEEMEMVGDW